ncbi:GCN5 family acetyltransferase [Kitasatospora sp. MMS16-BH015]|uniref:GNAT family N-acetyltransferase n=1 Tax=Kitasatospora sp. MMS16-BH015 TaxID=2018025 RepID=UPI000CA1578B|nr:GNAT family N-acetyltransferase [Kitasatospora sp. MMS16-BH015]AUG76046.1 GCN5 family acetyltransferase [Kitasatospora sp. MMS16-BH015]
MPDHTTIRAYRPADERSWLHCRVLSFLDTAYFDNVLRERPPVVPPGRGLVAVDPDGAVLALLDVSVTGSLATIESVAVRPEHRRRGLATALLAAWLAEVPAGVDTLDAWTRDDPGTLDWYRAAGFAESEHFLHVYADLRSHPEEPDRAIGARRPGLRPITLFLSAPLAEAARLRGEFGRVHVCRRFSRPLTRSVAG